MRYNYYSIGFRSNEFLACYKNRDLYLWASNFPSYLYLKTWVLAARQAPDASTERPLKRGTTSAFAPAKNSPGVSSGCIVSDIMCATRSPVSFFDAVYSNEAFSTTSAPPYCMHPTR